MRNGWLTVPWVECPWVEQLTFSELVPEAAMSRGGDRQGDVGTSRGFSGKWVVKDERKEPYILIYI